MIVSERVGRPQGRVQPFVVLSGGWTNEPDLRSPGGVLKLPGWWLPLSSFASNLVMYDQGCVAANLLTGHPEYRVAAMYFEFQNVADPSDPVTRPTYDRGGGLGARSSRG